MRSRGGMSAVVLKPVRQRMKMLAKMQDELQAALEAATFCSKCGVEILQDNQILNTSRGTIYRMKICRVCRKLQYSASNKAWRSNNRIYEARKQKRLRDKNKRIHDQQSMVAIDAHGDTR